MFSLCEMMKWAHLPVAGGIYDQHPKMIDDFEYISHRRAAYEAKEQEKKSNTRAVPYRQPSRGRRR